MIKDRTAIAGIGETNFGKLLAISEERLACEAILAAGRENVSRPVAVSQTLTVPSP